MAIFAVAGLGPVLEVFTWPAGIATVGIVALDAAHLPRRAGVLPPQARRGAWQTLTAPALGLVGLPGCLYLLVENLPLLMGGSTSLRVGAGVLLVVALLAGPVPARLRPHAALDLATASHAGAAPQI